MAILRMASSKSMRTHTILKDSERNISSPNFGISTYPTNYDMEWHVQTNRPYNIKLQFISFHLESGCCDFLIIRQLGQEIYKINGKQNFPYPFIFSNSIKIRFVTDGIGSFPGFQLKLQATAQKALFPMAPCRSNHMATSETNFLLSPYSPNDYFSNQTCQWTIAPRKGFCVQLQILNFQTEEHDILFIETPDKRIGYFSGKTLLLPLLMPIICDRVFLRFTADHSINDHGFRISYKEYPSPIFNEKVTHTLIPLNHSVNSHISVDSKLLQFDTLFSNNLQISDRIEYLQTQINDRTEEYLYQIEQFADLLKRQRNKTDTYNCKLQKPFPTYSWIMLGLTLISLTVSLTFITFTCCVGHRIKSLYLAPASQRYLPGKYSTPTGRGLYAMTLLTMGMAAPTEQLSSRDMIQELWAQARYQRNSGILFPSMQFRASESFFQINTLYLLCLSTILSLITLMYLCLQKKKGRKDDDSDSEITSRLFSYKNKNPKPTNSILPLVSILPAVTATLVPITNGTFLSLETPLPDTLRYPNKTEWLPIPINKLWKDEMPKSTRWTNPIPLYSQIFGYAIAEGKTYAEKYFPGARYWDNVEKMERRCLCERKIINIYPSMNKNMLLINTPISRNTGNKVRHRWKWTLKPTPEQFSMTPTTSFPLPNEITYPLLAIIKEKTLSLMEKYAVVQSNCSIKQELVNCETRQYDCIYSGASNPNSPDFTPIHYDDARGILWQHYYYKKTCNTSPNHRWVSVCRVSECDSINFEPDTLQCCDVSRSLWYGQNSGAYKSAMHSPCCPYGTNCYNPDIQNLWYRAITRCTIYGKEIAFEPIPTDIIIQEEYDDPNALNQIETFLKKWKKIEIPERIKIIKPTTNSNSRTYRDGPIKESEIKGHYETYPSMTKGDNFCLRRIKNDPTCTNLVGGIYQKLAFFDHVHYDPAKNESKFPSYPLQIFGSNGEFTSKPESKGRMKRQITGGVVLLTFLTSIIGDAITGVSTGLTLQEEINEKLTELESKMNERFETDEENIRTLSDHINSLEAVNVIQDQAIVRALTQTLTLQSIQTSTDQFLQSEIDTNRQLMLRHLDNYLRTIQTFKMLSTAEMELDKLIMNRIYNATGINLFDPSKVYLTKITQGNLYLKVLAEETERIKDVLSNQNTTKPFDKTLQNIKLWQNKIYSTFRLVTLANSTIPAYINISQAKWNPPNISINFSMNDVTPQEFVENIKNGLGVIPKTIIDTAGGGIKEITETIGKDVIKPLLPILIPLAVVICIVIGICLLWRIHPRFRKTPRRKEKLQTTTLHEMMNPPQEIVE